MNFYTYLNCEDYTRLLLTSGNYYNNKSYNNDNIYLWYLVFINFGSGYNSFDKSSQSVEIKRKGLFKDIEVKLNFDEIKSVKLDISEGFNPRRRIALVLKGRKKALPLSGAGELKPLLQVEEEGARLAKFLNVNLEGLK